MAELLHADAIQQLEVALLGSPVAQLINLLATGVIASTSQRQMIHPPQAYTVTPMVPPPSPIPIVGITDSPLAVASPSHSEATTSTSLEIPSKWQQITPTLIPQPEVASKPSSPLCPSPSAESTSLPTVMVPELAIPAGAQPKWINQPGGGKESKCQLCTFHHTKIAY